MYFRMPIEATLDLTSGVRATGEKTARAPVSSLTNVPRPPILSDPNRKKGTLKVVIEGVTSRMTMTLAGSEGMSFAADLEVIIAEGKLNAEVGVPGVDEASASEGILEEIEAEGLVSESVGFAATLNLKLLSICNGLVFGVVLTVGRRETGAGL